MFKEGDIVKFAEGWYRPGEEKYRYIVLETDFCSGRLKIGCTNSSLFLGSIEVVGEEMVVLA